MRVKLALWISLVIALQCAWLVPANAVLGLSACEKTTKAIIAEEKIGFESWNYYRQMVKSHNRDSNWNVSLADALAEVYKSDKTVWEIAKKSSKCYTPIQVSEIRRQLSFVNKTISDYKKLLKNPNFETTKIDWSIYYRSYTSAISILNKAKSRP